MNKICLSLCGVALFICPLNAKSSCLTAPVPGAAVHSDDLKWLPEAEFEKAVKTPGGSRTRSACLDRYREIKQLRKDIEEFDALAAETTEGSPDRAALQAEKLRASTRLGTAIGELKAEAVHPSDANTPLLFKIEVDPAQGGKSAEKFAADLYKTYNGKVTRHNQQEPDPSKKWTLRKLYVRATESGIEKMYFSIQGPGMSEFFRHESGSHALTGKGKAAAVQVELFRDLTDNERNITLARSDLDIEGVASNQSSVRVTHRASGLTLEFDIGTREQNIENAVHLLTVLSSAKLSKSSSPFILPNVTGVVREYDFQLGKVVDRRSWKQVGLDRFLKDDGLTELNSVLKDNAVSESLVRILTGSRS